MTGMDPKQRAMALMGATCAAERGAEVLDRGAGVLFMLATAIERTAEEDAGCHKADWAGSIRFVADGLSDCVEFMQDWLRAEPAAPEAANDSGGARTDRAPCASATSSHQRGEVRVGRGCASRRWVAQSAPDQRWPGCSRVYTVDRPTLSDGGRSNGQSGMEM